VAQNGHQQEATVATIDDPRDTGGRLIAATKVNGTAVYNSAGERLGSVYDVLLDKTSGHADYAILSFGGFLGIGDRYHPLPWNQLRYDMALGGYVVGLDRGQLEGAPTYDTVDTGKWGGNGTRDVDRYYEDGAGTGDAGLGPVPVR
jgi:sporulation protein YlmC with PRC-barrel domain